MLDKAKSETTLAFIPLHRLAFGHESPIGPLDVRKTGASEAADKQLKASLLAEGVIQSVFACAVEPTAETLYLAVGNRRLRLLRELQSQKMITADFLVPAIIAAITPAEARAKSLAENIQRADLHPVDRYEAFKQLADDGLSIEDIAKRTGYPRKIVEQSMALGALSPKIRAAWSAGTIDEDAAREFTIAADHARQDQVLAAVCKGLSKNAQPQAWSIRRELKADSNGYNLNILRLVGDDAYKAAGGIFTVDLFSDRKDEERILANPDILARLVEEKMAAECKRLVEKEGWKWAEIDHEQHRFMVDRYERRKYTDEEKELAAATSSSLTDQRSRHGSVARNRRRRSQASAQQLPKPKRPRPSQQTRTSSATR